MLHRYGAGESQRRPPGLIQVSKVELDEIGLLTRKEGCKGAPSLLAGPGPKYETPGRVKQMAAAGYNIENIRKFKKCVKNSPWRATLFRSKKFDSFF